jgi:isoleucyl-tRNA synthetase
MEKQYRVILPKTDFPMKANLPAREKNILSLWEKLNIYEKMIKRNAGGEKFILHDGPPYANGHIHLGHALNKILKDFIVKYKSLCGYYTPFIPGWDCHGLPIEYELMKELNLYGRKNIDKVEFRRAAAKYAEKFINIQREEFKRLGVFGAWDSPYITMDKEYESKIISVFKILVEKGFIYRCKKPVYWCISCETALAEAEIEYKEHLSPSIYVKFPIIECPQIPSIASLPSTFAVIWTTTPWTLPANVALAFHPEYKYSVVEAKIDGRAQNLIICSEGVSRVLDELDIKEYRLVKEFYGREFENAKFRHPLLEDKYSVGILAEFVKLGEGTGIVHIAPGHGEEDYQVGVKYGLEIYSPVDAQGRFTPEVKYFSNMNVFDANPKIIEKLSRDGYLLKSSTITHQYPYCWRCKNVVIFRATEQWFLNISHGGLRDKLIESIKSVSWYPEYGINRMRGMLESRPDWCLSRQRYWGTILPIVYCNKCNAPILEKKIIEIIEERVKTYTSEVWYTEPAEKFLPEGYKCPYCGSNAFRKEDDIIDVWFDSGVSYYAVVKSYEGLAFPADIYLEGSDQHRGWFQTSLIPSMITEGVPPYKSVITHGFVLDGLGRAMHKSLGNVIAPEEVISKYGAELLRLWVGSSDYHNDVRISEEILENLSDFYRKIRNTIRYLLGNLHDFSPQRDYVPYDKLCEVEKYMLHRLYEIISETRKRYENYEFNKVLRTIYDFCFFDLSSFYLDICKDRLYTFARDSLPRRSAQTVMYEITKALLVMLSPILSFTAEEAFQELKKIDIALPESVFLMSYPETEDTTTSVWFQPTVKSKWEKLLELRDKVNLSLEGRRREGFIGSSLEAKVVIYASKNSEVYNLLLSLRDALPMVFIVSQVEIKESDVTDVDVDVEHAEGKKCVRCWNYSTTVGSDARHPALCRRCVEVVNIDGE